MESEFVPVRKRWFVERRDFGRQWVIVLAEEDQEHRLRLCAARPGMSNTIIARNYLLSGNESPVSFFDGVEAQQLMDALYEAGLRPTRR